MTKRNDLVPSTENDRDTPEKKSALGPRATSSMIGGAALGGSLAGPIGALIGGVAGWAVGAGLLTKVMRDLEKRDKGG